MIYYVHVPFGTKIKAEKERLEMVSVNVLFAEFHLKKSVWFVFNIKIENVWTGVIHSIHHRSVAESSP